jgi:hypothetical protein
VCETNAAEQCVDTRVRLTWSTPYSFLTAPGSSALSNGLFHIGFTLRSRPCKPNASIHEVILMLLGYTAYVDLLPSVNLSHHESRKLAY